MEICWEESYSRKIGKHVNVAYLKGYMAFVEFRMLHSENQEGLKLLEIHEQFISYW
jgi:hypothetical protein